MAGTLAPTIPTIGQPNSTEDVDIRDSITVLRDGLNAILNSSNGIDYPYHTLVQGHGVTGNGTNANEAGLLSFNGAGIIVNGSLISAGFNLASLYLDTSDHKVANKTAKYRIRAQVMTNSTSPGAMKWTFSLYPIQVSGAANQVNVAINAAVGSSAVIENPSTAKITNAVSATFNAPATAAYALGVICSAKPAANSAQMLKAELQVTNQ